MRGEKVGAWVRRNHWGSGSAGKRRKQSTQMGKEKNQKPPALTLTLPLTGHAISNCVQIQKKHTPPGVPEPTALKSTHLQKEVFLRAIDKNQLQGGRISPHPQESKTLALKSAQVRDYQNRGEQGLEHYGRDS